MAWMFRVTQDNACTEAEALEVVKALNQYKVGGGVARLYTADFVGPAIPGVSYSEPEAKHEWCVDYRNGSKHHNVGNMRNSWWWRLGVMSWWAQSMQDEAVL